jgi:dTDP-glucose 4,6-dehydratase
MTKILITGGAGFIGSHFVKLVLRETDWEVINLDVLTYAGNLANLAEVAQNPRYRFVQGSITDGELVNKLVAEVEYIANFAAETHVDNSIAAAGVFVQTNVAGVQTLLDAVRQHSVTKYLQVSTDEVYGCWPLGSTERFTEESPLAPNNPYSASKAGGDLLCRAAYRTHGVPVVISRCSNNYGTHQLAEKLIPLTITRALRNEKVPVYGDGQNIRDWIHVEDHCRALLLILQKGTLGEIYNVGANNELDNLTLVKMLLKTMGKSEELIELVTDRPGHDRRYAIDSSKIQRKLGWMPQHTDMTAELAKLVEHYAK